VRFQYTDAAAHQYRYKCIYKVTSDEDSDLLAPDAVATTVSLARRSAY